MLKANENNTFTYEKLVAGLKHGTFKKVVVVTGTGISLSAGIPDYRSDNLLLNANLHQFQLPTPDAIFDINYFKRKP